MEPTIEQLKSSGSPGSEADKSAAPSRICLITLGGEFFAIDLRHVREVFELESITPVPGMPLSLVGVANLRGTVVPLADLRPALRRGCIDCAEVCGGRASRCAASRHSYR